MYNESKERDEFMPYNSDNEYIMRFVRQCTCDRDNIPWIINKYRSHVIQLGRRLCEGCSKWSFAAEPGVDEELLDFIDGNGFIVESHVSISNIYHIIPIQEYRGLRAKTTILEDLSHYDWEP